MLIDFYEIFKMFQTAKLTALVVHEVMVAVYYVVHQGSHLAGDSRTCEQKNKLVKDPATEAADMLAIRLTWTKPHSKLTD